MRDSSLQPQWIWPPYSPGSSTRIPELATATRMVRARKKLQAKAQKDTQMWVIWYWCRLLCLFFTEFVVLTVFLSFTSSMTVTSFSELARSIAANWKSAAKETKDYCEEVARIIKGRHTKLNKVEMTGCLSTTDSVGPRQRRKRSQETLTTKLKIRNSAFLRWILSAQNQRMTQSDKGYRYQED